MKTFVKTILGLSLLVGSASYAQDNLSALYPAEDVDSPSYTQGYNDSESYSVDSLAISSLSDNQIDGIFGSDSKEYKTHLKSSKSTKDFTQTSLSDAQIDGIFGSDSKEYKTHL